MENSGSILHKTGRWAARCIKIFVRGLPEEKFYVRPPRRKYLRNKNEFTKPESKKRTKPRITRREIDRYALLKEKQRIGER
jgi:hypothetical protein